MGTVSGMDASKLALGIDISHYDGVVPASFLKRFSFAWVKAADGDQLRPGGPYDYSNYVDVSMHDNVQACWDADIPCGLYVYIVPSFTGYTMQSMIDHHFSALKAATKGLVAGKSYHAIALDLEEEKVTQTDVNWMAIVKGLADKIIKDPEYTAVQKVVIYSRIGWLEQRPAVRDEVSNKNVLDKYHMWLAQWIYSPYGGVVQLAKFEDLIGYINNINMRVLTPGYQTWDFVQWAGEGFKTPEVSFRLDLNFFRGDQAACWDWFGFKPRGVVVVPPPEEPPVDDTDLGQRVAVAEGAIAQLQADRVKAVTVTIERGQ